MRTRAKRLPRLWCALQGLLPLEDCCATTRTELVWPVEPAATSTTRERGETAPGGAQPPARRAAR